jgi:hypothetical protein
MNVMGIMDSRFRGNDKLCYIFAIERLTISLASKTVSLSKYVFSAVQNKISELIK